MGFMRYVAIIRDSLEASITVGGSIINFSRVYHEPLCRQFGV